MVDGGVVVTVGDVEHSNEVSYNPHNYARKRETTAP